MKTDQQVRRPSRFRVGGASLRRAPWTALTFAIALVTMVVASAVMAGCASANSYSGLLSASASVNVPALIGGVPAGSVYDQQSWSAPSGVQFHGFAYTAGSFWDGGLSPNHLIGQCTARLPGRAIGVLPDSHAGRRRKPFRRIGACWQDHPSLCI